MPNKWLGWQSVGKEMICWDVVGIKVSEWMTGEHLGWSEKEEVGSTLTSSSLERKKEEKKEAKLQQSVMLLFYFFFNI